MLKEIFQNGTVSAGIAIGATIAFLLGAIEMSLYLTLLGLGGFSGIAALRTAIDSSGKKTYIVAIGGGLISIGVATGLVTPEIAVTGFALLGIGAVPTLAHGLKKAKQQ